MSADPHRVHERAVSLTVDEWVSLLGFPSTCATLGKRCPNWVRALCELADATGQVIPRALLDALGRGEPHEKLADCESDAASMGQRLGLCVIKGGPGSTVKLLPTPFGFAVSFVSKVRAVEAHLSVLEGTRRKTRIGVEYPRIEAQRRLSAALPRAASPLLDHIESLAMPPSDGHDQPKALPPGTSHDQPKATPQSDGHDQTRALPPGTGHDQPKAMPPSADHGQPETRPPSKDHEAKKSGHEHGTPRGHTHDDESPDRGTGHMSF